MSLKLVWLATPLLLACLHLAQAQQPKKIPRIGYLRFIEVPVYDAALGEGLRELDYVDGQNIPVDYRFAGGKIERSAICCRVGSSQSRCDRRR